MFSREYRSDQYEPAHIPHIHTQLLLSGLLVAAVAHCAHVCIEINAGSIKSVKIKQVNTFTLL